MGRTDAERNTVDSDRKLPGRKLVWVNSGGPEEEAFVSDDDDYVFVDGEKRTFSRPPRSWEEAVARARHTQYVSLAEAKRRRAEREAAGETKLLPEEVPGAEDIRALPTPLNPE